MAVDIQCMTINEATQALRTAQLEQLYQQTLAQAERIYEDERARNLRVQLLLLEDENEELRDQMDNDGDDLSRLENTNDELRDQLADIESQYQAVQMELKAQLRDLDRYKTEVTALNAARVDSNLLLCEKLALTRELATLKPELDHLKSQATLHQSLLGQKLSLERELSSIQVELDTEKRTVQRLKAKDKNTNSADVALNEEIEELKRELMKERRVAKEAAFKDVACVERIEELERDLIRTKHNKANSSSADEDLLQEIENLKKELEKERRKNTKTATKEDTSSVEIEGLKKELAKAKREAQKVERENLKKAADWDAQKEVLEEKLDAFRVKLRTTKEQLKEAQDDLEKAEQAKFAAATEASKVRMTGANPRKRTVARFDPEMMIGTPGHGGPAKKQRISVDASEKSTFSITPFLNKTMSILPESPEDEAAKKIADQVLSKQIDVAVAEAEKEEPKPKSSAVDSQKPKAPTKKTTASKAKTAKPLQESTNPKANTLVKKAGLAKVMEEEEEADQASYQKENQDEMETKAARKKVNKQPTIFDDDEDVAPKKTKKLNLGGLKSSGLNLGKVNLSSKNKVLAEFSPLKKDRKAVVNL